MADKTRNKTTVSRDEFAEYLRSLADAFDSEGPASVNVGNKRVSLRPAEKIAAEVEVVERSSLLRGDRESLELEASWKARD